MDKKTKAFWDMLGIDIAKKHYYHFVQRNGNLHFDQSGRTIEKLYSHKNVKGQDWRLDNCWFYVNAGLHWTKIGHKVNKETGEVTPYYKEIEERTECHRKRYRAFYFDFDLKDTNGNHYQGNTLRNKKNALLRDIKKKMPLQPTIVETRNGYHVYLILANADRFMEHKRWNTTEKLLVEYMRQNVNANVDSAVSDGARVLRIPESYHVKSDSERIEITVKQVQEKRYTHDEIYIAFDIATLEARKQAKKQKHKTTHTHTATNNATSAIKALDADYYDYVPVGKMDTDDARKFLLSQDLLEFLQISTIGAAFCSPLRKDDHASASVFCKINEDTKSPVSLLYDHAEEQTYNIFDIVTTLAGCDNKTAWRFLCDVYGINISVSGNQPQTQNVDEDIKANIKAYKEIAKHKGCEYLKDALPTYKAILKIWKEQTIQQPQIEPYNLFLLIGREYVKTKAKISEKTISRHINVLYKLNIIRHINNEQQNGNKKRINMCKVTNLKDADKQTFIKWTTELYDKCDGAVWFKATKKELTQDNFSFKIFDKK